ncbi:MAG: FAD:protein FMN transferase [Anaerolineae bacterium]
MLHEHRFRAMNTDVGAWLWSSSPQAGTQLQAVETSFATIESELSRFRPESGLSMLNASAGAGPQPVSPLLQEVLVRALEAAQESQGLFDPTVLGALCHAGYDRSFELITPGSTGHALGPRTGLAAPDWRRVSLDPIARTVTLPAGLGIDLGGIAKGWAVDQAAEALAPWGPALVDAGGDMRATAAPGGEPWPIAVQNPFDPPRDFMVLTLERGAIATSSIGRRQWQRNGQAVHHLIDPRNGRSSQSDLHTVTTLAPSAAEAEITAKVALLLGLQEGERFLRGRNIAALLIDRTGGQTIVGPLPATPIV